MRKRSKNYKAVAQEIDLQKKFSLEDAVGLVRKTAYAKFDESIDLSVHLNLKKSHVVRDVIIFPHTFKKQKTILVFAKGDKADEARKAGADFVGDSDLVEKIQSGWFDFDVVVATPDMMKDVGRLGMLLGRKGLMPNPKTKTVTNDLEQVISELKKGRVEFRADKTHCVHLAIGKLSMSNEALLENIRLFMRELFNKKPADLKGEYIESIFLSSTMGPGVPIQTKELR